MNKTKMKLQTFKWNKILIKLRTTSADEYEYSSKTRQIYSGG